MALSAVRGDVVLPVDSVAVVRGVVDLPIDAVGSVRGAVVLPVDAVGAVRGTVDLPIDPVGAVRGVVDLPIDAVGSVRGAVDLPIDPVGSVRGVVTLPVDSVGSVRGRVVLPIDSVGSVRGGVVLPIARNIPDKVEGEVVLSLYQRFVKDWWTIALTYINAWGRYVYIAKAEYADVQRAYKEWRSVRDLTVMPLRSEVDWSPRTIAYDRMVRDVIDTTQSINQTNFILWWMRPHVRETWGRKLKSDETCLPFRRAGRREKSL